MLPRGVATIVSPCERPRHHLDGRYSGLDEGDPGLTAYDPLSKLANAAEGDVAAAYTCASQLLALTGSTRDRRDARLLLTSVCLHLHTHGSAELTASDLVDFLGAPGPEEILAILRHNPLSLTEYAVIELSALSTPQQSSAVSLALAAAKALQAA